MSENLANGILALAITGWGIALITIGAWWGERGRRIFIQNFTSFGGTPLRKARVYDPPDEHDRLESTIDRIQGIAGVKRTGPVDGGRYEEETIENGIAYILEVARANGEQVSMEQARDEAERMLNAEGSEM